MTQFPAPAKPRLLVVDDDGASRRLVAAIFGAEGFDVLMAAEGRDGIERIDDADLVLLDLNMPEMDGLAVLEAMTARAPHVPVVMLTASHEIRSAVRATRLGAYDYLTKPIDQDEVVTVARRALETRALRKEVDALKRQLAREESLAVQMGPSEAVQQIVEQVSMVAASRFTVLVLGETGTGKELVAQAIHDKSERRDGPFVALDCGAIPEQLLESELFGHERGAFTGADRKKQGRFRLAEGGTLFLDEIGNLPQALQAKLLRVLESQQVVSVGADRATPLDVRFVAATNDDLQARVARGVFRADLYFRLAQYTLALPPLRERAADVAHLARRFAQDASIELRRPVREIDPDAIELLEKQAWPGNVRELRNVVRQAVLTTKDVVIRKEVFRGLLGRASHAPAEIARDEPKKSSGSLKDVAARAARDAERAAICEALRATHGNKSQAARMLTTDYKTLHLKMKSLAIRARDFQT